MIRLTTVALALIVLALPSGAGESLPQRPAPDRPEIVLHGTCTASAAGGGGFVVVETLIDDGATVGLTGSLLDLEGLELCNGSSRVRVEGFFSGLEPCPLSVFFPLPQELGIVDRILPGEAVFEDGFETGDLSAWE